MNSDSESLQHQLLTWLTTDNAPNQEHPSVECEDVDGVKNTLSSATSTSGDFESVCTPHTFQFGEIPSVQERFQAVLKRRLQIQVENNPPLFPWESQLTDYPDYIDSPSIALVPAWGWTAQQSKLNLPIPLPKEIFQQLLERCQALVSSSLPLGAKLVQVVESFFPNDSQTLNDYAGLVLRSPYRSQETLARMPNLESEYSHLQPSQQMVLSLLAAKGLLENLTLLISIRNPVVEKQWLTSAGMFNLKAEYLFAGTAAKLRVQAQLPTKGILKLTGPKSEAMAQSLNPGSLSVELCGTQLNQTYTLEVDLTEIDTQPLLFVITPTI